MFDSITKNYVPLYQKSVSISIAAPSTSRCAKASALSLPKIRRSSPPSAAPTAGTAPSSTTAKRNACGGSYEKNL